MTVFDSASNREVYLYVDSMPEFPGGEKELLHFISKNLRYPENYIDDYVGKIFLSFIIEPDGQITYIKVLKGWNDSYNQVAKDVIEKMPKWNPGKCFGTAVPVRYIIPINFGVQ